jgi:stage V sporulation protein R
MSKLLYGSSLLCGNNTIPGAVMPEELRRVLPDIFKAVRDYGCDYYPAVVEVLRDDEISEIAAYSGFPVRYPHWSFGMEYEQLQTSYELGLSRIYELVINTDPCYIYCLSSNSLVDNVTVVAHALGHNDFFKNNIFFSKTDRSMMDRMANHGSIIRRYMHRWGREKVTEFIDHVLRLDTLIDPAKAGCKRKRKEIKITDERKYYYPRRLKVDNPHMEEWINTREWVDAEKERVKEQEACDHLEMFLEPTRDILGYLRDNAPLKIWQADILSMLYDESMYFYPQGQTKLLNEGFASKIDYEILAKQGFASLGQNSYDNGIVEYAVKKMGVLGGKYAFNPYKLGFYMLQDIEKRWDRGMFGAEWDNCPMSEKKNWNKNLGLGKEKIFEVRQNYNDFMFVSEYFTEDFCNEFEFFEWERNAKGEYVITSRDYNKIKQKLLRRYLNFGRTDVRLVDPNFRNRGWFLLEHVWDGKELYEPYLKAVLTSIRQLWNEVVMLTTKDKDGVEFIFICDSDQENEVEKVSRVEFDKSWRAK